MEVAKHPASFSCGCHCLSGVESPTCAVMWRPLSSSKLVLPVGPESGFTVLELGYGTMTLMGEGKDGVPAFCMIDHGRNAFLFTIIERNE